MERFLVTDKRCGYIQEAPKLLLVVNLIIINVRPSFQVVFITFWIAMQHLERRAKT